MCARVAVSQLDEQIERTRAGGWRGAIPPKSKADAGSVHRCSVDAGNLAGAPLTESSLCQEAIGCRCQGARGRGCRDGRSLRGVRE